MLCALVPGSSSELPHVAKLMRERGLPDAPYMRVPLGSGLFTGVEQTLPAIPEADQQIVQGRRDVYKGERRIEVPVPGGRFHGSDDRFLLTANRDAAGAKRFFRKAFQSPDNPSPRVINVDKNPAYPVAIRN